VSAAGSDGAGAASAEVGEVGFGRAAFVSHFGECVVATLRDDLDRAQLVAFRGSLLGAVRERRPRGVILDVSALELIDPIDFDELRRTLAMVELMGTRTVLVGLSAAVIAALLDLGADVDDLAGELTLEAGLARVSGGR
jgi:rsbT antagonist protein RsbS